MLTRADQTTPAAEEPHLVRAAQGGDREACAALVERYWDRLHRWLYHLTHDRHAAEDLTQEAFLKAFGHLHSFQAGTNFRAWLFRIAHNTFLNQRRGAGGHRQPLPDQVADPVEGPEEQAQAREGLQRLAQAIAKLPTELRAAFLLRAEEGLAFRQIADALDLTEETARWRVFKARQKLVQVLAPELDGECP